MNYLTACREHELPVLLESMERHCRPFKLWALCWDFEPAGLPAHVTPMTQDWVLDRFPLHRNLPGPPRATINKIDTARWRVATHLIRRHGPFTYVDGDQWFWSSPAPIFEEIGSAPMAVSPHRIPPAARGLPGVTLETHRKYGLYNSGFVYFADAEMADQLAWACYLWSRCEVIPRADGTYLFGDQGHLERLAGHYGAHVIQHPGLNVAPWNVHRYGIMKAGGRLFVVESDRPGDNMAPLVSYHYSSMRFDRDGRVRQFADPGYAIGSYQTEQLYLPYAEAVVRAARCVR